MDADSSYQRPPQEDPPSQDAEQDARPVVPSPLNPATTLLENFLIAKQKGGQTEIPYEELSRVAGTNVQIQPGYGYLKTARERVKSAPGDVWDTVRNVGLRLVPHAERARWAERTTRKVNREVARGKKVMGTTDLTQCSQEDVQHFNAGAARLLILGYASAKKVGRKLLNAASSDPNAENKLSVNKALSFLGLRPEAPKDKS